MPRFVVTAEVDVEVDAEDERGAVAEALDVLDTEACILVGMVIKTRQEDAH